MTRVRAMRLLGLALAVAITVTLVTLTRDDDAAAVTARNFDGEGPVIVHISGGSDSGSFTITNNSGEDICDFDIVAWEPVPNADPPPTFLKNYHRIETIEVSIGDDDKLYNSDDNRNDVIDTEEHDAVTPDEDEVDPDEGQGYSWKADPAPNNCIKDGKTFDLNVHLATWGGNDTVVRIAPTDSDQDEIKLRDWQNKLATTVDLYNGTDSVGIYGTNSSGSEITSFDVDLEAVPWSNDLEFTDADLTGPAGMYFTKVVTAHEITFTASAGQGIPDSEAFRLSFEFNRPLSDADDEAGIYVSIDVD